MCSGFGEHVVGSSLRAATSDRRAERYQDLHPAHRRKRVARRQITLADVAPFSRTFALQVKLEFELGW